LSFFDNHLAPYAKSVREASPSRFLDSHYSRSLNALSNVLSHDHKAKIFLGSLERGNFRATGGYLPPCPTDRWAHGIVAKGFSDGMGIRIIREGDYD
jgi:hypothetical protein